MKQYIKTNILDFLKEEYIGNDNKIIYDFDKIAKFIQWFNEEYGDYSYKQGWAIFDSDTEEPNEKYNSVRKLNGKNTTGYYWQVQKLDVPEDGDALFGELPSDISARDLAKKLGIMVDEYGVVYGYDGQSFL